jgi:hypothetical protein
MADIFEYDKSVDVDANVVAGIILAINGIIMVINNFINIKKNIYLYEYYLI